mmetsp:Transcript_59910/g.188122  ORF Transcript_59910/g.188122 Transcript_59910/m.188122 type:complete len:403 (+) Transcript_59910:966-2174(+)
MRAMEADPLPLAGSTAMTDCGSWQPAPACWPLASWVAGLPVGLLVLLLLRLLLQRSCRNRRSGGGGVEGRGGLQCTAEGIDEGLVGDASLVPGHGYLALDHIHGPLAVVPGVRLGGDHQLGADGEGTLAAEGIAVDVGPPPVVHGQEAVASSVVPLGHGALLSRHQTVFPDHQGAPLDVHSRPLPRCMGVGHYVCGDDLAYLQVLSATGGAVDVGAPAVVRLHEAIPASVPFGDCAGPDDVDVSLGRQLRRRRYYGRGRREGNGRGHRCWGADGQGRADRQGRADGRGSRDYGRSIVEGPPDLPHAPLARVARVRLHRYPQLHAHKEAALATEGASVHVGSPPIVDGEEAKATLLLPVRDHAILAIQVSLHLHSRPLAWILQVLYAHGGDGLALRQVLAVGL